MAPGDCRFPPEALVSAAVSCEQQAATRRGVTMNLVFVNPVFVVVAPEMNATQASDPGRRRRMSDLRNPIGLRSTSIAKIKSVAINQFT